MFKIVNLFFFSSFLVCEGGNLALTATALHYKPPGTRIKWSLALNSITEIKREVSGYLSSGKITISVKKSGEGGEVLVWMCQVCEEVNESQPRLKEHFCKICGSIQKGKLLEVKIDVPNEEVILEWKCEVCEETNEGNRKRCSSCGFPQPEKVKEPVLLVESDDEKNFGEAQYKFSFRSGGSTIFHEKLQEMLRATQSVQSVDSVVVGISGLLRQQQERNLAAEASLSTAFSDLDALMRSAGEMVSLAAKIADKMKHENLTRGQRNTFNELVESLGIESVTPENDCTAGTPLEFYRSIALALSTLVQAMISKTGTRVFSLADVYCLYNRTRTTGSLVAPADLLKAARQLSILGAPIRLHQFTAKGILCLLPATDIDPRHLFTLLHHRITEKDGGFVTAVDLAERLKISVLLAGEQLAMAENAGEIVRDAKRKDLPAFYPNLILSRDVRDSEIARL